MIDPLVLSYGMGGIMGGTKGTRGGEKKPGSWRVFLEVHVPKVLLKEQVSEVRNIP